ncbi:MAG: pirin family protein, partial [Pseudomonadota bacterium]
MTALIEQIIKPREKDLGDGFVVRRILPFHSRKMVGPFIFFDHFGPVDYAPGKGFDVRPHPHIGLATVTFLYEGAIRHKDTLGNDLVIRPGAVNWMTAGRGICHSERTPDEERANGQSMHGIQTWVALPKEYAEIAPDFVHHPAETLPEFDLGGA